MLLQEIIKRRVIETQTTITENIKRTIQENECASKEAHVRERTIKIAYLHFLQCQPFIV